jgi:phosphoenolpyruvate synthase/pyruvate phosphate dikinase
VRDPLQRHPRREFAERFDGFSIGSNDLTQLTLGVDRDSGELANLFSEADPAVIWMIETLIARAHEAGAKVGLCGQAPSNNPAFAKIPGQGRHRHHLGDARQFRRRRRSPGTRRR